MFGISIVRILKSIRTDVADNIKKRITDIIEDKTEMMLLKKRISSRLSLEWECLNHNTQEADFDYNSLSKRIVEKLVNKNTLRNILLLGEKDRELELKELRILCLNHANAKNEQAEETAGAIFDKSVRTLESFFRDKISIRELSYATVITDEIYKHFERKSNEQNDLLLKRLEEIIKKTNNQKQSTLRSDNKDFLSLFEQPLFLDKDNPNITLKNMYITPMVREGNLSAINCITNWFQSNKNCMILCGEAGIGKTSLISKMINDACLVGKCSYTPDKANILAVALREHCAMFEELPDNYSPKDLICKLFNVQQWTELENKLLILDGFDELTVLTKTFGSLDAYQFFRKLEKIFLNDKTNIHILVTTRPGYFRVDGISVNIETLCWTDDQVEEWCIRYSKLKSEREEWCIEFPKQYRNLLCTDGNDELYEILCIPFILYLCCNSQVDLTQNKTICQIYDKAFRTLLLRNHSDSFIASERFIDNKSDIRKRLIYWQYTKEIAYQMFLLNTLDLVEVKRSDDDIQSLGLKNARTRTLKVLKERYSIDVSDAELCTTEYLSVFSFAKGGKDLGVTFAHKTVYEYFTAVKIYEDVFSKFDTSFFETTEQKSVYETVFNAVFEAFRYHSIPSDVFTYLCEMDKHSFSGIEEKEEICFDFHSFLDVVLTVLGKGYMSFFLPEVPTVEYFYPEETSRCAPIHAQIIRALRSLICFITGKGYVSKSFNDVSWIKDVLVESDQYVDFSGWNLRKASLERAYLKDSVLISTDFSYSSLKYACLENANMASAELTSTNLSFANMESVSLEGTRLNGTIFKHAYLGDASFSNARLSDISFEGVSLEGANMKNLNMKDMNFNNANLNNAVLTDSALCKASFRQAMLSRARLSGADLSRANLKSADLSYVDLSNANLDKADMSDAVFLHTNLDGANLMYVKLVGIKDGTFFSGRIIKE